MVLGTNAPTLPINLWQDAQQLLHYEFMQRAFLAGTLISIMAGLIGTFVILRHQTFAGESLSDVAFTGAIGGAALGLNPLITLVGTTVIVALVMGGLGDRLRGRDVAIGTVLAWILGVGVLFLSMLTVRNSSAGTGLSGTTVLFGNLLGISPDQIGMIAFVSSGIMIVMISILRPLLFASIDPDIATARGIPVQMLGLGFMVILAVTISMATMAVGALLVFALLLLPAAIAQQLTPRPYRAIGLSVGIAIGITWLGISIGFYTGYPSSICISLLAFMLYIGVVSFRRGYQSWQQLRTSQEKNI
jgi:zinc/manganese transport system permease protein